MEDNAYQVFEKRRLLKYRLEVRKIMQVKYWIESKDYEIVSSKDSILKIIPRTLLADLSSHCFGKYYELRANGKYANLEELWSNGVLKKE